MSDNFTCPITLEKFKEPIIIPTCGHTFDKTALLAVPIKKCPICKTDFGNDINAFPINWSVASHLNLDIKKKPEEISDDILSYDAAKAKADREVFINNQKDILIKNILHNIKILASKGTYYYEFDFKNTVSPIINAVVKDLNSRKFNATLTNATCIYISWNN